MERFFILLRIDFLLLPTQFILSLSKDKTTRNILKFKKDEIFY